MSTEPGFYIGKQGTLYYKHENGRLTRFGVRIDEEGLKVFDYVQHVWYDVPDVLPTTWKDVFRIQVEVDE